MVGREDVIAQEIRRPEIVIAADDLSGAADCAAACAVRGLRTLVQLAAEDPAFAQVLAIDAETRSMPAERAAATAERLFAAHRDSRVFYKKIDSLLRGHVGAELAAMLRDAAPAVAVMAPALPAQGRVTIGGCQWLNGERLASADAPRVLNAAGLTSIVIGFDMVRGGQLAGELTELAKRAARADGWVQLFNGKDLTGWKVHPQQANKWKVDDGVLVGTGGHSNLFSGRGDYRDFELRLEGRISE